MQNRNRLYITDKRRSHELKTLGGLISPVWAVAEEVLGSVTENISEELEQHVRTVCVEARVLLDRVVEKSFERNLEELDVDTFKEFYHQSFVAWQKVLHKFVRLLDEAMISSPPIFTDTRKIQDLHEKLKKLLDVEEKNVS